MLQGIFILDGSGKIGKSWLALDMCVAVSTGGKLWEAMFLYLALEDTRPLLQNRLQLIQEENINTDKLYLAFSSLGISDGLVTQMKEFLSTNPNKKLIVIDTLDRISTDQDKNMYARYETAHLGRLQTLMRLRPCSFITHAKMYYPDPLGQHWFNWCGVIEKEKRIGLNRLQHYFFVHKTQLAT